jgi:hypothetical protein
MPNRRVVVRHPRADAAQPSRQERPAIREMDEQSVAGDVLVQSLIRAQLGLAFAVLALFAIVFGMLGASLVLTHGFHGAQLFGIPVTWILLGPPSFATIAALGWLYRRQADRNEQDFIDVVERS